MNIIYTTKIKFAMELSIFHKILKAVSSVCVKNSKPITVDKCIKRLIKKKKKIIFVQIGASDCGLNDPIRSYILEGYAKGLIIEPIKKYLLKAKDQYRDIPNLSFANVAIDYKKGARTIFKIREIGSLPDWAYQVCSFSKDVLLKHAQEIPNIADIIEEESVETENIGKLMKESGFNSPDLLVVDTEGYDSEILKMFPFNLHRPLLVIYEHKHLSREEKNEAASLLKKHHYSLAESGCDIVATLN